MTKKIIHLACGLPMTLKMVSLQKLAATDIELPNQARQQISDLVVYGAMLTGGTDDKKRAETNWSAVRSQMQLAKLLAHEPKVWLCTDKGDMPDKGYISDDDLFPVDLAKILDFFYNGGSDGVPAAAGNKPDSGAPTDLQSPTVAETAE